MPEISGATVVNGVKEYRWFVDGEWRSRALPERRDLRSGFSALPKMRPCGLRKKREIEHD